jgi:hypothetical protein
MMCDAAQPVMRRRGALPIAGPGNIGLPPRERGGINGAKSPGEELRT